MTNYYKSTSPNFANNHIDSNVSLENAKWARGDIATKFPGTSLKKTQQ